MKHRGNCAFIFGIKIGEMIDIKTKAEHSQIQITFNDVQNNAGLPVRKGLKFLILVIACKTRASLWCGSRTGVMLKFCRVDSSNKQTFRNKCETVHI
jgi:hypothetical protein